jgi:5'-nucleotidase
MIDPLVLLEVTGKQLLEGLENGVSMFPKLEGRFPQVSGINFAFDPEKPAGKRIDPEFVKVGDEYLDLDPKSKKTYRLATKAYLANGKDGYDVLAKCKQLIDEENGPTLAYAVQNHFAALAMREGRTRRSSVHHQSLVTLSRKHSIVRQLTDDGSHHLPAHVPEKFHTNDNIKAKLTKQTTIGDLENTHLNPKTEGRIRVLSGRVREESASSSSFKISILAMFYLFHFVVREELKHKKELDLQEFAITEEESSLLKNKNKRFLCHRFFRPLQSYVIAFI